MKINILANFFGKIWGVFSGFLFIPIYIDILGFDSYAFISFTFVIAGFFRLIDSGLTSTISREVARIDKPISERVHNFQTIESTLILITIIAVATIVIFSDFLITEMITNNSIDHEVSILYLRIVIVEIACQLLIGFYKGGLLALNKQVHVNLIQVFWGVLRNGIILLPIYFYPELSFFFYWQLVVSIVFVFLFKKTLVKEMGHGMKVLSISKIDTAVLKGVWRFSLGIALISIVASINSQTDKFAISKYIGVTELGYYTLALTVARAIQMLIMPIVDAILPRLTEYFTGNDRKEAIVLYQKANLFGTILIYTLGVMIIMYGERIVWAWTGDIDIAQNVGSLLDILTIGIAMLSLQNIPYSVAIANGYTRYNNIIGISSLVVSVPLFLWTAQNYGIIELSLVFTLLQFVSFIIYEYLVERHFIRVNNRILYYLKSYIYPLSLILATVFVFNLLVDINDIHNRFLFLILWSIQFVLILLIALLVFFGKEVRSNYTYYIEIMQNNWNKLRN